MKNTLFCFVFLLLVGCAHSQYTGGGYSTSNKKAISLFEEAMKTPGNSVDPITHGPNFRGALDLLAKAIEKDPNFWEAELVAGEYCEELFEYEEAIGHYQRALSINPNHSTTGSTYFYLANLQFTVGMYDEAIRNCEIYVRNKNANPEMVNQAYSILESSQFAKKAIANPVKYNPINVGPGINTKYPEYFPTITVDGKTILFTRRIPDVNAPTEGQQEDFFVSHLGEDGTWQSAYPMPKNINTIQNEGAPTISADGRSLIFVACADLDGKYGQDRYGKGSCDLFYTKKLGARWSDPVNIPGNVNTFLWESQPSLSADGQTLYFVRRVSKRGEQPNADIFVSNLQEDGTWSAATPLPKTINTPLMEESVLIHPDGKTLYFASRGHVGMGGLDLYVSHKDANGNWSQAQNLGYPINTPYDENSLMVSPEGNIAFFASNREGGFGDLDIYYFEMPEHLRPTRTIYFEGIVFDANTKDPLPGKFELTDLSTGEKVMVSEADMLTGEFMVSLPVNRDYALNVSYKGYNSFSENFNLKVSENQEAFHMDVPLVPIAIANVPIPLKNVFFDLDKAKLRPESFIELNKFVEFLTNNPNLIVEIGGHTDTRGDAKANQILSENRSKSVVDYLISKGIDASRLQAKGYGETLPKISDAEIEKMTSEKEKEAAHQQNRRTEYKIIN